MHSIPPVSHYSNENIHARVSLAVMDSAEHPVSECAAWIRSPSLELCECASTSFLPHWVTASTSTNQDLRSGGQAPWIIRQKALYASAPDQRGSCCLLLWRKMGSCDQLHSIFQRGGEEALASSGQGRGKILLFCQRRPCAVVSGVCWRIRDLIWGKVSGTL